MSESEFHTPPTPPDGSGLVVPSRRDPVVSKVVRQWRVLTTGVLETGRAGPGAPMLIACSGGADSTALMLALAATGKLFYVAHVMHDLRPANECEADRDAVAALAKSVGMPFVEARVSTRDHRARGETNAEGLARKLRYRALADLAVENGVGFVATGHHANDQLESMVMGLIRGAGPRGLRGIAASRLCRASCGETVTVVRPMLGVTRVECEELCSRCGVMWREDATNADTTRTRSAVRHRVVPILEELRPGAAAHASNAAGLMRDVADLAERQAMTMFARARGLEGGGVSVKRETLREATEFVIGRVIQLAASSMTEGRGADRLTHRTLERMIGAIRDEARHPRAFTVAGVVVKVTAKEVRMERARG